MFWTKKRQKFHWFLPCLHWNLSRKCKTFFYVPIHPGLIIKNMFLAKSYVFILHTSWIYGLIFSHLLHQICCCLVISLVSFFKRFQNLTVEGRLNKNDVNEETEKAGGSKLCMRCLKSWWSTNQKMERISIQRLAEIWMKKVRLRDKSIALFLRLLRFKGLLHSV